MPTTLVPLLLVIHVGLALALFLPSLLLPFAFRARRAPMDPGGAGPIVRGLLALQGRFSLAVAIGLAVSGVALVAVLGWSLLSQPWLLAGVAIYLVNLGLAFFVQRPSLQRLIGLGASGGREGWAAKARRQRYLAYLMAGLTGTIGVLMSTKPVLW